MEKINILPTTLFKYDIPDNVYNSAMDALNKLDIDKAANRHGGQPHFGKSTYGKESLHRQSDWKLLCDFINPKLKEVAHEVGYSFFEDIKVCLMWANKSMERQWHHAHEHQWSIFSGIIYLEGESGNTWFSQPSSYSLEKRLLITKEEDSLEDIHIHEPVNKTMLIFPSLLRHSVSENFSTKPRTTISFNSFFDGSVGNEDGQLFGLKLKLL
jgi:uncharacterized protein (TIGR02466 family)